MSHARIEEISDSEPEYDSDPSEDDIEAFDERGIIKARGPKPSAVPNPNLIDPRNIPGGAGRGAGGGASPFTGVGGVSRDGVEFQSTNDEGKYKDFQCIYPVYFDKKRTRGEGRRVGVEGAVENPLAREIVAACGRLRLETLFEPSKIHPKDWANPGRVKVRLKGGNNPTIKNKHHLYTLISKHLLANPTTVQSALAVRVPGLPAPDLTKAEYPKPAIPRGWKIGEILPYYSPGLTGGGVSENFLKDMMAEMGGAGGMPGGAGGPGGMAGMLQGMMGGGGGGESSSSQQPKIKDKKKKGKP